MSQKRRERLGGVDRANSIWQVNTFTVRSARTSDVAKIRDLVRPLAVDRILLDKESVTYYESIQEFVIAEDAGGNVAGCGGLHVIWEDIAEIRTLATGARYRGQGVGHALIEELLRRAKAVGVSRVFCLTFEVAFFERHGFTVMEDQSAVDHEVYQELLHSRDEGVAEFLDLARVKPNTLGNTRMILAF